MNKKSPIIKRPIQKNLKMEIIFKVADHPPFIFLLDIIVMSHIQGRSATRAEATSSGVL